uniref:G_PROTEIN_RECEP_F1_2 domain-containing protein n=1 Tax=Elaeophora elaphi TaxID=1147741 RepID=A0A0R3RNJ8_9BILA
MKPVRYRSMRKTCYVITMTLPAVFYAVAVLILVFIYNGNDNAEVICVLVAVYRDQFDSIWGISSTLINFATICLYLILDRTVVKGRTTIKNLELLQTLRIIMLFLGMGHFASLGVFAVTKFLNISEMAMFYMRCYGGILINISVACNWLFYYWRSTEYRNEFKRQLRKFTCLKNSVTFSLSDGAHTTIHQQSFMEAVPRILRI